MPSDADVMLRLRDIVCAARTCRVASGGKHTQCSRPTASISQGL